MSATGGSTQTERILKHLREEGSLTPLEALDLYGCSRLAARVCELKQAGHHIQMELVQRNGKKFARYSLPLPKGQLDLWKSYGTHSHHQA